MHAIRRLLIAAVAVFPLTAAMIAIDGLIDRPAAADAVVVPGNTVDSNGKPSQRLASRLDVAVGAYKQHLVPLVIVSGGMGREGFNEAEVMAGYLIAHGVPTKSILLDSNGINTAATATNVARILRARGLGSVLIATQFFHVTRTRLALQRSGLRVVGSVHARYFELRDVYSLARETVGLAAYAVGL